MSRDDPGSLDWYRLAEYVVAGRVRLGYRVRGAFAAERGVNVRVLSDIETAKRTNYDRATLAKLEQELGWSTGSVNSVLRGGEPRALDPGDQPAGDRAVVLQIVEIMETDFKADTKLVMIQDVIARDFIPDEDLVDDAGEQLAS